MATVVAFHAHPDDEVLMTGGTLACAAAEGHRVVVVTATDGNTGEATGTEPVRMRELRASCAALGVHRVLHLGYADSGRDDPMLPDPPGRVRFARADTETAAEQLAEILRAERADVLLSYDATGGYGHPDHVQVHKVGRSAATRASVALLLEATLPREPIVRALRLACRLGLPLRRTAEAFRGAYTPRAAITHRVDTRRAARRRRAALAAHRSQLHGTGQLAPVMRFALRLPVPVFGLLLGREWYVEPGATPAYGLRSSIFAEPSRRTRIPPS
ncbi:PIG-L deacetylase family protein [Streptomyces sp. NPDC018019]|uniref:PIG-L deacetylase family protein n=1 Tax=Streptomyces sp. NPDC018019 TaxID=3365030 RepID=UPI00378D8678